LIPAGSDAVIQVGPEFPLTRYRSVQVRQQVNRLHTRFAAVEAQLEKGWQAFCELRDVLQLTNAELPNGDTRNHQIGLPALEAKRLETIAEAAKQYQGELRERIENAGNEDG